jgi:hypothetical protein
MNHPFRYFIYRIHYNILCLLQMRLTKKLLSRIPAVRRRMLKRGLKVEKDGELNWKKYYANRSEDVFLDRGILLFTFIGFLPLLLEISRMLGRSLQKSWRNVVTWLVILAFLAIGIFVYNRLYGSSSWHHHYQLFEGESEPTRRRWRVISFLTIITLLSLYVLLWWYFI